MTTTITLDEMIRAKARRDLSKEFENHLAAFPWPNEWHVPTRLLVAGKDGTPEKITLRDAIRIVFEEAEAAWVGRREQDAVRAFLENHEHFAREIGVLQDQIHDVAASQS